MLKHRHSESCSMTAAIYFQLINPAYQLPGCIILTLSFVHCWRYRERVKLLRLTRSNAMNQRPWNTWGTSPRWLLMRSRSMLHRPGMLKRYGQKNSFKKRRQFLRILLKYVLEHQDLICEASSRDTEKAMVDASLGEIMTTCEKIAWLLDEVEKWLNTDLLGGQCCTREQKIFPSWSDWCYCILELSLP